MPSEQIINNFLRNRAQGILQDILDNLLQDPGHSNDIEPGLVPIGDTGLYMTPDTPADPTDCTRYPDSPVCGGNPISLELIGLNPQITITDCDIGIRLNPVLGFIKLPPFELVYRKPECRQKPPPLPPTGDYKIPLKPIPHDPASTDPHCLNAVIQTYKFYSYDGDMFGRGGYDLLPGCHYLAWATMQLNSMKLIALKDMVDQQQKEFYLSNQPATNPYDPHVYTPDDPFFEIIYSWQRHVEFNGQFARATASPYITPDFSPGSSNYSTTYRGYWNPRFPGFAGGEIQEETDDFGNVYPAFYTYIDAEEQYYTDLVNGRYQNQKLTESFTLQGHNYTGSAETVSVINYATFSTCGQIIPDPPPPPLNPRCYPMQCCCPTVDPDLLKSINAKLKKLSDIVGVDQYPATVPSSLITKNGSNPGNTQIASLTGLLEWYILRFDELMGQWEVPIQVEDEQGNTTNVVLPNLAEAIAEISGLHLNTSRMLETILHVTLKTLFETGSDKIQNFKTNQIAEAFLEYINFKNKEEPKKIGLTFTPGKEKLEDILKETELDIPVVSFTDKNSLKDHLLDLLQAAAIIRAQGFRKIDTKKGASAITNLIKGLSAINQGLSADVGKDGKDELDRFIEEMQQTLAAKPNSQGEKSVLGQPILPEIQRNKLINNEEENNSNPSE